MDGEGTRFKASDVVSANVTYYAAWKVAPTPTIKPDKDKDKEPTITLTPTPTSRPTGTIIRPNTLATANGAKTGDETMPFVWAGLAAMAGLVVIGAVVAKRKKKDN